MGLFELDFKVRHECALGGISRIYPDLRILRWCENTRNILEIIFDDNIDSNSDLLMENLSDKMKIVDSMIVGRKIHIISLECSCQVEQLLNDEMEHTGLIHLSPVVYRKGWEYHRVIAMNQTDIDHLMRELKEQSVFPFILRKVPFEGFTGGSMTVSVESLFSHLTEKQTWAMLTAYRFGYYEIPRRNNLQTIATKTDLARTTYQEHLKKAERKIIEGLVPHLHAWFHFYGNQNGRNVTEFPYWIADKYDKKAESA